MAMASAFFFFDAESVCEFPSQHLPTKMDACALCAKPLGRDSDIFMYRGDTPFCSEECRDEQMQLDATRARQATRSAAAGRRQQQQYSSSRTESRHQESRKVSVAT